MSSDSFGIDDDDAARAHRVLRAVWVIVSASHHDAVARDVAQLGQRLRNAIERGDRAAAAAAVGDVKTWLATMAGVVTSRLCQTFELDDVAPARGRGDRDGSPRPR